mmetsp:Transcript_1929/g.4751  ORF Transcript_1929/g.4751 Transcript_1929/m.4751 type:complete len:295 (+) Transcript_1929:1171-2055(+)
MLAFLNKSRTSCSTGVSRPDGSAVITALPMKRGTDGCGAAGAASPDSSFIFFFIGDANTWKADLDCGVVAAEGVPVGGSAAARGVGCRGGVAAGAKRGLMGGFADVKADASGFLVMTGRRPGGVPRTSGSLAGLGLLAGVDKLPDPELVPAPLLSSSKLSVRLRAGLAAGGLRAASSSCILAIVSVGNRLLPGAHASASTTCSSIDTRWRRMSDGSVGSCCTKQLMILNMSNALSPSRASMSGKGDVIILYADTTTSNAHASRHRWNERDPSRVARFGARLRRSSAASTLPSTR